MADQARAGTTVIDTERPLVVSDVDLTLWCGCGYDAERAERKGCQGNDEVIDLLRFMAKCGWEVRLWSAGGIDHCRSVRDFLGLDFLDGVSDKPPYPIQSSHVMQMFGRLPSLTLDDDKTEAVEGVPLLLVEDFHPHWTEETTDSGLIVCVEDEVASGEGRAVSSDSTLPTEPGTSVPGNTDDTPSGRIGPEVNVP